MLATQAYERREHGAYWRAGLVTAAIYNTHRKKGTKALTANDFVPKRRKKKTAQSAERMAAILKAATLRMGGEVVTR
jgi:uncharacterized phage-associated protein